MRRTYTRCPKCGNWTFDKHRNRCETTDCGSRTATTKQSSSQARNVASYKSLHSQPFRSYGKDRHSVDTPPSKTIEKDYRSLLWKAEKVPGALMTFVSSELERVKNLMSRNVFGGLMIFVWVFLWLVFQFAPYESILPYSLGWHGGFLPLQLLTYSFFHLEGVDLLCNVVTLAGVIHISRYCLNGAGFFRAYSLGIIGSGSIYLWLLWLFGEQDRGSVIIGGTPAIVAMLVTLAVLRPKLETSLLGDFFEENAGKYVVLMIVIGLAVRFYGMVHLEEEREYVIHTFFDQLLMTNFIRYFIILPILLTREVTPVRIAVWLVLPDLVFGIIGLTAFGFEYGSFWWNPSRFFTFVAAILMGLIYGTVEKIAGIFAAKVQHERPRMDQHLSALQEQDSSKGENSSKAPREFYDFRIVPLVAQLKDRKMGPRKVAAEALGRIGNALAVHPLIAALRDRSYNVRTAAAAALGKIGDARAVDPLIAALRDRSYSVRAAAATALGEIGDARAVDPLISAHKDLDKRVSMAASAALRRLDKTP